MHISLRSDILIPGHDIALVNSAVIQLIEEHEYTKARSLGRTEQNNDT